MNQTYDKSLSVIAAVRDEFAYYTIGARKPQPFRAGEDVSN
jgi:hypothetical protein